VHLTLGRSGIRDFGYLYKWRLYLHWERSPTRKKRGGNDEEGRAGEGKQGRPSQKKAGGGKERTRLKKRNELGEREQPRPFSCTSLHSGGLTSREGKKKGVREGEESLRGVKIRSHLRRKKKNKKGRETDRGWQVAWGRFSIGAAIDIHIKGE